MTTTEATRAAFLRSIVQRYRVLWNIFPKHLPDSLKGNRIGFEIELWGTHDHPGEVGKGECFECREVVEQLEGLAEWIAPSACEFRTRRSEPVDSRTNHSPRSGIGRSVRVGIDVVCRGGHNAVSSQCDARCILRMKEKLIALGSRRI